MRSRDEITALGRAAGDTVDRLATTPAQQLHAAIADRAFSRLGPAALPARTLHDGISTAVYAGVRAGVKTGAVAGAIVAKARGADPELVSRTASRRAPAGDTQRPDRSRARAGRRPARGEPRPLARRHPDRGRGPARPHRRPRRPRARALRDRSARGAPPAPTASASPQDGWTPLHVRYNTGLPILENGRKLSWLLDDVVARWPVPVERIALVGHSMGGLVTRVAGTHESQWRKQLTHVACLGSPHQGAPLEQVVHRAAGLLARLPETAPLRRHPRSAQRRHPRPAPGHRRRAPAGGRPPSFPRRDVHRRPRPSGRARPGRLPGAGGLLTRPA